MSLINIRLSERQSNISSSSVLYGNGTNITSLDYNNIIYGLKPNFANYAQKSSVSTTDKVYNAVYADTGNTLKTPDITLNNNFICSNITTSTRVFCSSNYGVYYYKFLAGSNYSFSFNKNTTCKLFMIGGGGGGGTIGSTATNRGGGGAGAYYKDTAYTFYSNITYGVYVGIGGISSTNGGNTYITSNSTTILTAIGGGTSGSNGGCGGGAGFVEENGKSGDGIITSGTYSRGGYNGGNTVAYSTTYTVNCGGGGGCGGNGGDAYFTDYDFYKYGSGKGGNGISIDFIGTTEYYGGGGAGGGLQYGTTTPYPDGNLINRYFPGSIGGMVNNNFIGGYHSDLLHSNIPPVPNTGSGGCGAIYLQSRDNANRYPGLSGITATYSEKAGSAGVVIIAFNNYNINIAGLNVGIDIATPSEKLDVNGSILCTGIDTTSDIRLKTDILTLNNSLSNVLNLRGVEFKMINNINKKCIGLIAQETEKVIPEVVLTSSIDGYKSISYGNIVAVLIEAIKEQNKMIENLKIRIQNIKKNKSIVNISDENYC